MMSMNWGPSGLRLYRGGTLAATDATPTPPWLTRQAITMGSVSTPSNHCWGLIGGFYVDGGISDPVRSKIAADVAALPAIAFKG
jgi:hypothetical protein